MLLNVAWLSVAFFYCYTLCDFDNCWCVLGVVYVAINDVLLNVIATRAAIEFVAMRLF